jgi:hypothetical protein
VSVIALAIIIQRIGEFEECEFAIITRSLGIFEKKSMRIILFCLASFLVSNLIAQSVLINEIDADQPGSDSTEFVELYGPAGTSLDGYVLVFFNGGDAMNASYQSVDLMGMVIPNSGFFVVGNANVSNVNVTIPNNTIQNGADAVVLYNNTTIDEWPNGTLPVLTGAIDAIVYGTADAEDLELMAIFAQGQIQLDEGAANNANSLSRYPDGGNAFTLNAFVPQGPTPGATNGGSTVHIAELNRLFQIFPNPGNDVCTVRCDRGIERVMIYDVTGTKCWDQGVWSTNVQIDLVDWPAGCYMVQIQGDFGFAQQTWIKQ